MGEELEGVGGPDRIPGERRAYIPDSGERQRVGLWIASTRVEKFNDWAVSGRCKHQGMSWSSQGVLALAALEAARENGELDAWRRTAFCPSGGCPTRYGRRLEARPCAPTRERYKILRRI